MASAEMAAKAQHPEVGPTKRMLVTKESALAPEPTKDHEAMVLWIVDKRLRTFRKKLEKIEGLEARVNGGDRINDQQKEVMKNKDPIKAVMAELQKVRSLLAEQVEMLKEERKAAEEAPAQQVNNETQTAKSEMKSSSAQVEPSQEMATAADGDAQDGEFVVIETVSSQKDLQQVVQLFQSARLFQPSLPGSDETRSEFLSNQAGTISPADLDALQFASSLIDGSGNPFGSPDSLDTRVNEGMLHAQWYLDRSEKELTPNISYGRVHDVVDICLKASASGDAPATQPNSAPSPYINFFVDDLTGTSDTI